jgi:hypothetical protein
MKTLLVVLVLLSVSIVRADSVHDMEMEDAARRQATAQEEQAQATKDQAVEMHQQNQDNAIYQNINAVNSAPVIVNAAGKGCSWIETDDYLCLKGKCERWYLKKCGNEPNEDSIPPSERKITYSFEDLKKVCSLK